MTSGLTHRRIIRLTLFQMTFFAYLLTSLAHGAEPALTPPWKVVHIGEDSYVLRNTENPGLQHEILREGSGDLEFREVKPTSKSNIVHLIYFAGTAASSQIVIIYRSLVYNTETKTFLGDYTYHVKSPEGQDYPPTSFSFQENGFVVVDKTIGLNIRVPY